MTFIIFGILLMSFKDELFKKIATELINNGVCVIKNGVPDNMAKGLQKQAQKLRLDQFKPAAVGRGESQVADTQIRSDDIHWMDGNGESENDWLLWMGELQQYLNRHLFLGLFSFESHFSHYSSGDFYKKHYDAFKGQANRILSVVTYLNENWQAEEGGELLVYGDGKQQSEDRVIHTVSPEIGTLVIFLSEQFPHEVLRTKKDRYSIAGWFRVNGSGNRQVDPPR
jgi:SM-20-related protein